MLVNFEVIAIEIHCARLMLHRMLREVVLVKAHLCLALTLLVHLLAVLSEVLLLGLLLEECSAILHTQRVLLGERRRRRVDIRLRLRLVIVVVGFGLGLVGKARRPAGLDA